MNNTAIRILMAVKEGYDCSGSLVLERYPQTKQPGKKIATYERYLRRLLKLCLIRRTGFFIGNFAGVMKEYEAYELTPHGVKYLASTVVDNGEFIRVQPEVYHKPLLRVV